MCVSGGDRSGGLGVLGVVMSESVSAVLMSMLTSVELQSLGICAASAHGTSPVGCGGRHTALAAAAGPWCIGSLSSVSVVSVAELVLMQCG